MNPDLIRRLRTNRVIFEPKPGSDLPAKIDYRALCANPSVMADLAEVLAFRIIGECEGNRMHWPTVIAANGLKDSIFAQWVMLHITKQTNHTFKFRWHSRDEGEFNGIIEPQNMPIRPDDKILLCTIDIVNGTKRTWCMLELLRRPHAKIVGIASAMNGCNLKAVALGVPTFISVLGEEELVQSLREPVGVYA